MVAAGLQCASLLSAAAECHVLLSSRKLPLEVCTARTCAIHQLNSAIAIRDEWMRRTFLEGTQCAAFCTGAAANMKHQPVSRRSFADLADADDCTAAGPQVNQASLAVVRVSLSLSLSSGKYEAVPPQPPAHAAEGSTSVVGLLPLLPIDRSQTWPTTHNKHPQLIDVSGAMLWSYQV